MAPTAHSESTSQAPTPEEVFSKAFDLMAPHGYALSSPRLIEHTPITSAVTLWLLDDGSVRINFWVNTTVTGCVGNVDLTGRDAANPDTIAHVALALHAAQLGCAHS